MAVYWDERKPVSTQGTPVIQILKNDLKLFVASLLQDNIEISIRGCCVY